MIIEAGQVTLRAPLKREIATIMEPEVAAERILAALAGLPRKSCRDGGLRVRGSTTSLSDRYAAMTPIPRGGVVARFI